MRGLRIVLLPTRRPRRRALQRTVWRLTRQPSAPAQETARNPVFPSCHPEKSSLYPAHASPLSPRPARHRGLADCGEVVEWSIAPHSKCGVPLRVPWVRIPPSPPLVTPMISLNYSKPWNGFVPTDVPRLLHVSHSARHRTSLPASNPHQTRPHHWSRSNSPESRQHPCARRCDNRPAAGSPVGPAICSHPQKRGQNHE